MASYTDAITQFNPYIAQQPVEAMVKVGMEKQQLYNEGIQKIQTGIDNVAGLDIMKDPHKKYLQSKLDELGSNLTKVAGGDFSNFQLVNSVGGMTNQIVKDPIIQNAVSSTALVRKGIANMDAAKKDGKSSPSNEWVFNNGVNNWLGDGNINSSYTGDFKNYLDYDKLVAESLKNAHADKLAEDENIIMGYDKQGNAIINHDLIRHQIKEGLSTSKTMSIIREVYSRPDVKQQLSIDGLYKYKDYSPDDLIAEKRQSLDFQKEEILNANPLLKAYSVLSDGDRKIKADKNLESNYQRLMSLNGEFDNFQNSVHSNFDGAKINSFIEDKVLTNTRNSAWTSLDTGETRVSPQFTVNEAKAKLQLAQATYADAHELKKYTILNIKSEIDKREFDKQQALYKLTHGTDANGNLIYKIGKDFVDPEKNSGVGSGSYYKDMSSLESEKNQLFADITSHIGVTYNGKEYKGDDGLYINDGATGNYKLNPKYIDNTPGATTLLNPLGQKIYEAANAQIAANIQTISTNHLDGTVTKNYRDLIKKYWDKTTVLEATKKKAELIEAEFKPVIDKLNNLPGLENNYAVQLPSNKSIFTNVMSGKGLMGWGDFNISKSQLVDISLYYNGKETVSQQALERLKASLNTYDDANAKQLIEAIHIGMVKGNNKISMAANLIDNNIKDKSTIAELNKRELNFRDAQRQNLGNTVTLSTDDNKIKEPVRTDLIADLHVMVGDRSGGDYETALKLLTKKAGGEIDNNEYSFTYNNRTGKWFVSISNDNDGKMKESGSFEVSPGFVQRHNLNNELDPNMIKLNGSPFGQLLDLNQGSSTTSFDINSNDAGVRAIERSNIGNFSVGYQLQSRDRSNTSYIPYLYITDSRTGKTYNGIELDWSKLAKLPGLSNDEKVLLKNKPSAYESRKIIDAIDNFKTILNSQPNPDAAITLLIDNYDNK